MPDYLIILIPSSIGLITAICAAYLSAKWTMRRACQERWWERKEKVYTEIIEALHDIIRYSSVRIEEYKLRSTNPKSKKFRELYSEAYWRIQKMTDIGAFVISEQAASILQKLRDKPEIEWDDGPPEELHEEELENYRETLNEIRKCAKKDLCI